MNTKIIEKVSEHFGELIVSRGTKNKLLGMDIEFEKVKLLFLMKD